LLTTPMKLADIAERLGYAEAAPFISAFKRWKGISPDAYRRAHRAAQGRAAARA